ncbi:MAG: sigma 54-interacting transcriptional regulator [Candidatus Thiodiazotropha sp. (ex Dulcina madagascariensis)]|nr:sigma 54-interacting transcriptional regulator [Candidatus Thiodiazotropha sp. (ex Epidulcina cf. delphinae)]MCU7936896.1 sigma 54-interacting transcriptional regulator [Candidatus Thiodiazotropha sp. (ex Dulcina madagascariensis)]
MARTRTLTEAERKFFSLLADTIFSNPFSSEKGEIDSLLADYLDAKPPTQDVNRHDALIPIVDQRLSVLESDGIVRLDSIRIQDRQILEYAFLFQTYHRHLDDFDKLIQKQNLAGDKPVSVGFAKTLLGSLHKRGFSRDEALRYIALFYQLRRAYYFIENALVGDCPSMEALRRALWNNVFTADIRAYGNLFWNRMEDFSTLLLGETGSGKGSAAAAIGRSGLIPFDPQTHRFEYSFHETFIATNLSQFPETLIESELFGHRKGAFTGAVDNHKGLFERCSPHGSLFLDEIGELTPPVQIKLLNVLQERSFTPVGSHSVERFEGRVIAATNQDLQSLRRQKRFRDDFFYRLSSDIIEVPPLRCRIREKPGELEQLVRLLVTRMTGQSTSDFEARILETLSTELPQDYPWPGNVRELEQAIRRIILTGHYQGAVPTDSTGYLQQASQGALSAQELLSGYCRMLYKKSGTYEAVAKQTALDRRTVKKYVENSATQTGSPSYRC